ncbi:thioredoxin family protein [Flavobacterium sp.]|uniref:thioredoxin family protein n=1 Tax=Flavobacterium sp. TaxID=239 RepID=UPI0038FC06C0
MKKLLFYSLFFTSLFSYSQDWKSNFEEAKVQAEKENKNIFLVFSGSDWCAPCIKLDKNVWQSEAFKNEKNWILYKADFPKKKEHQLSDELVASNKKLADKYNKTGVFPLVLLLNKSGKVLGMSSYKKISAEDYIKIIKDFEK